MLRSFTGFARFTNTARPSYATMVPSSPAFFSSAVSVRPAPTRFTFPSASDLRPFPVPEMSATSNAARVFPLKASIAPPWSTVSASVLEPPYTTCAAPGAGAAIVASIRTIRILRMWAASWRVGSGLRSHDLQCNR